MPLRFVFKRVSNQKSERDHQERREIRMNQFRVGKPGDSEATIFDDFNDAWAEFLRLNDKKWEGRDLFLDIVDGNKRLVHTIALGLVKIKGVYFFSIWWKLMRDLGREVI
jgi:hypothetical protein